MLDLERAGIYRCKREFLYTLFRNKLNDKRVLNMFAMPSLTSYLYGDSVFPFCIPIILASHSPDLRDQLLDIAAKLGVETRPICTGNIVRQTPFADNYKFENYPNSEHLHNNGFYIGLHAKVRKQDVEELAEAFSKHITLYCRG